MALTTDDVQVISDLLDTKLGASEARLRDEIGQVRTEMVEMEGRMNTKFDLVRSEIRETRYELGTDIKIAQRANAQLISTNANLISELRRDLRENGALPA